MTNLTAAAAECGGHLTLCFQVAEEMVCRKDWPDASRVQLLLKVQSSVQNGSALWLLSNFLPLIPLSLLHIRSTECHELTVLRESMLLLRPFLLFLESYILINMLALRNSKVFNLSMCSRFTGIGGKSFPLESREI